MEKIYESGYRNYPRNCWWVAARSTEIDRKPKMRWLLDTPVALYRNEDGHAVALDNRCPHRWAKLSDGHVQGNNLVCPYHGAQFGPDGKCKLFPSQDRPPSRMQVQSFPVLERGLFIWIWLGDPDLAVEAPKPPELELREDKNWFGVSDGFEFSANYFLLQENVLDLTHFNHVHAESFGIRNWNPSAEYVLEGSRAGFKSVMRPEEFEDQQERSRVGLGHPDTIDQVHEGWLETPALHHCKTTVRLKSESGEAYTFESNIYHMVTPANPGHTHYWWLVETNAPLTSEMKVGYNDFVKTGYLEDKVILESIQDILNNDPRGLNYPEFNCNGDAAGVYARRVLKRYLDAEKTAG